MITDGQCVLSTTSEDLEKFNGCDSSQNNHWMQLRQSFNSRCFHLQTATICNPSKQNYNSWFHATVSELDLISQGMRGMRGRLGESLTQNTDDIPQKTGILENFEAQRDSCNLKQFNTERQAYFQ